MFQDKAKKLAQPKEQVDNSNLFDRFSYYLNYETLQKKLEICSPAHIFAEQLGNNPNTLNLLIVETIGRQAEWILAYLMNTRIKPGAKFD